MGYGFPVSVEKMEIIRHECPCIALGLCFRKENRKPLNEVFAVFIIIGYPAVLYSSAHDIMQEAGRIESGYPRHDHNMVP